MEPRFGHDFGRVRVHTDASAAESARAVNAQAYTVGHQVVFGENRYAPATHAGRQLLAHELAHTIQQRDPGVAPPDADANGEIESAARTAGRTIVHGESLATPLPTCGVGLSRSPKDDDEEKRRAAAIAEATAVAARITKEQEEDEAEAKAEREEREKPVSYRPKTLSLLKPDKTPSKFSPGGFTDEEAKNVYKEAEDRMKLGELALKLAEKQARRVEFWEGNPSYNSADVKEAFDLDLYWDPEQEGFIRQPYVFEYEHLVNADPEAKGLYDSRYGELTTNKPEKKNLIRRILDPPVHFICKHTEPCTGIIEQMHKDKEGGMSDEEALKRGLTRLTVEGAMVMLPGEGPSGPIEIGPGRTPGGVPFDTPALETGTVGGESNVAPKAQPTEPPPIAEPAPAPKPMEMAGKRRVGEEHETNIRPSTEGKHQTGQTRTQRQNEAADFRNALARQTALESRVRQLASKIESTLKNLPKNSGKRRYLSTDGIDPHVRYESILKDFSAAELEELNQLQNQLRRELNVRESELEAYIIDHLDKLDLVPVRPE
jgi:hypothetical protein